MKKITALHKYIGIAVCIILIHLAVTGIFLNHTQDLDLDKHYVTSSWILDQYGLKVPQPDLVYAIQNDNFSQYGVELFFNGSPVIQIEKKSLGCCLAQWPIHSCYRKSVASHEPRRDPTKNYRPCAFFHPKNWNA